MAFTKITASGIGSTETVTLDGLTVINNVSIGGTLTYEDVTNIDSVGLITARAGVVVGSGITLSKDGDVFFTGIATGNGSGLTALNASNISSGTVPTARLGSGTASSSTFLAGDSTFKTVTGTTINNNADNRLITGSGTANTLEGEANITFDGTNLDLGDSKKIRLGASQDLELYHDGSHSYISETGTGSLLIQASRADILNAAGTEFMMTALQNGAVSLYYDNTKRFETTSSGATVTGQFNVAGVLKFDNDVNSGLDIRFEPSTNSLDFVDNVKARFGTGDDLSIYHDATNSIIKNETGDLYIQCTGGTSDDIIMETTDNIFLKVSGSEAGIYINGDGSVELYYDATKKFETKSYGVFIDGDLQMDDNDKIKLGNGNDLQLYHDNGNNYIGTFTSSAILFSINSTHRWTLDVNGVFKPAANNTYDIGTTSARVRNIYTNDLNLSNEGSSNNVDGTWGDYTIQEGESDLFLINNRNGKKYKFNLTEVS